MSNDIYVQRKKSKLSDNWIHECTNRSCNPTKVHKVKFEHKLTYVLEDMGGPWDKDAFDVISPEMIKPAQKNAVVNPSHYDMMGTNTIEILACAMTKAEWRGFCLGNTLKYRIRAGKKDALQQDIDKANNYERLYEEHKHLCRKE